MRALPRLALLLAALLLAGCADREAISQLRTDDAPAQPWVAEHRGTVEADHAVAYDVPVFDGASSLLATLVLAPRTGGLADDAAPPARLTLALLAPDGSVAAEKDVDATAREAALRVDAPAPGAWQARVTGHGVSADPLGAPVGAAYTLLLEVAP